MKPDDFIDASEYQDIDEEEMNKFRKEMGEIYKDIILALKKYLDVRDDYYHIITTWIIGTYLHENFYTYPYLFFNAMKSSGKSRALKLIASLSNKGELIASLNEAVLFRSEKGSTLCIDEFESVGSKEKQALRELLNAAYKKGTIIKRVRETRKLNADSGRYEKGFEVENLEPYRPIAMANIWGMDEVLNDRCIQLILEKSNQPEITNMLEIFDLDRQIIELKERLQCISVVFCSLVSQKTYIQTLKNWNVFIKNSPITYTTTLTTFTTSTNTQLHLFEKIRDSGINARALELSFAMIYLSSLIGEEDNIIRIFREIMNEKREDEAFESKDVMVLDFVARREKTGDYEHLSDIVQQFRLFLEESHDEILWLSNKWFGRALKRLAIIKSKRSLGRGIDVILDNEKADAKMQVIGR